MEASRIAHNSLLGLRSNTGNRFPTKCHLGLEHTRVPGSPRISFGRLSVRFSDSGHQQYYISSRKETKKKEKEKGSEIKSVKKKLKFIKSFSGNFSLFSFAASGKESGNSLISEDRMSEAVQVLQAQLQQLRLEQKELKRNMKEQKAQSKATSKQIKGKHKCESSSSSSSSDSSDSENGEVIDMFRLRVNDYKQAKGNVAPKEVKESTIAEPNSLIQQDKPEEELRLGELSSRNSIEERCLRSGVECCNNDQSNSIVEETSIKRIEICMGGKCKKSGAGALLEEFERKAGAECDVSACKCMGKCKHGPNLRVSTSPNGDPAPTIQGYVRPSINSLCIGVGLEDVDMILANMLDKDRTNDCLMVPH